MFVSRCCQFSYKYIAALVRCDDFVRSQFVSTFTGLPVYLVGLPVYDVSLLFFFLFLCLFFSSLKTAPAEGLKFR